LDDAESNRFACRAPAHPIGPWSRFVGCDLRDGVLTGCGGGGASGSKTTAEAAATQGSATAKPTPGYPGSIVILGDSRGTGDDSDPNRPNTDVPSNDWAIGTNPAVVSVYLRLLARDPAIKGHNYNLAQDGTNIDVLANDQAPRAVKLTPGATAVPDLGRSQ
jgi:hypothetical protein